MLRLLSIAIFGALCAAGAPNALAHAMLDRAAPPVGSAVRASPPEVRLWFSEELEPAFCRVRVTDAAGHRVDRDDAHVDAKDARILEVSVPPLGPGHYRVIWRVVSIDTHITQGQFAFEVRR